MAPGQVACGVDDARPAQQGERRRRGTVWGGAKRDPAADHRQAATEGIVDALTEALIGLRELSGTSTGSSGRLSSSSAQQQQQEQQEERAALLGAESEEKIMTGKKAAADPALASSSSSSSTTTTSATTTIPAATKEVRGLDPISHVLQSCREKALLEAFQESGTRDRRPLRLVLTALLQAVEQARPALDRAAVS